MESVGAPMPLSSRASGANLRHPERVQLAPRHPERAQRVEGSALGWRFYRNVIHARGAEFAENCSPGRDLFHCSPLLPSTPAKDKILGSAFSRCRRRIFPGPPRTPRAAASVSDGGAPVRELRVNHVAQWCLSAERVQIPRLRAARSARDDNGGSAARSARHTEGRGADSYDSFDRRAGSAFRRSTESDLLTY